MSATTRRPPRPRTAAPGCQAIDATIDAACRTLQLPSIRERYDDLATCALAEQANYKHFLADLLTCEVTDRGERRKHRLVREAGFPRPKRLDDFDHTANPTITPATIGALTDPAWVRGGRPCA